MSIVVIGSVFVDIKGYPLEAFIAGGRNMGRIEQVHGGVCRNVAENIANLELRPIFVSLVDRTGTGADVLRQLRDHKVNTDYMRATRDGMGTWLAIFDNTGDVVAASPWGAKERTNFTDDFGCTWTFVPEAGGPMLTPGVAPMLSDITKWETEVKWPDFSKHDYVECKKAFNEKYGKMDKVLHLNIGQSCTERLVALLGGYEQAMVAMAVEPEAVHDFLMAFATFTKDRFLKMAEGVQIDFVTFHDDWGTEKDTFFSPAMMEEMVFEPTKLLLDAIKSTGARFELHSCGRIERFVPYMIDLGVDFIQLQRRANDVPMLKEKYGDKIGFNTGLEGFSFGDPLPEGDELVELIHKTVDMYGKGGGFYTSIFGGDPKQLWDGTQELYYYSREFYEK